MTADTPSSPDPPAPPGADSAHRFKVAVLRILDAHRWMAIATSRADGWPHATMVGYVHDDLAIYFVIARDSQKFANIERDPRISLTMGAGSGKELQGLSMAARAFEVRDLDEIQRLNTLLAERYREQTIFAPRGTAAAVMRATPQLISLTVDADGVKSPTLLHVVSETVLIPA